MTKYILKKNGDTRKKENKMQLEKSIRKIVFHTFLGKTRGGELNRIRENTYEELLKECLYTLETVLRKLNPQVKAQIIVCPDCDKYGFYKKPCTRCQGKKRDDNGNRCARCKGTGLYVYKPTANFPGKKCLRCGGTHRITDIFIEPSSEENKREED
jgi:hypothetical protein